MQSTITGKAYILGDNVDTDQIIPAQYLTLNPSIPDEYQQFGIDPATEAYYNINVENNLYGFHIGGRASCWSWRPTASAACRRSPMPCPWPIARAAPSSRRTAGPSAP